MLQAIRAKTMGLRDRKKRKDAAAASHRGLKLLAERRRQEAYDFLGKAVQQFPDEPEIRMHYATSLLAVRPADAVSETKKAISLDPDEPIRLTRAASLLFSLDEIETARVYATRAKELAEPDFSFFPELINLDGNFAALEGKDELAEQDLREAVEQDPSGETFAVDLAKFLSDRDRQEEALAVIDQALPRTPRKEPLERLRSELLA